MTTYYVNISYTWNFDKGLSVKYFIEDPKINPF